MLSTGVSRILDLTGRSESPSPAPYSLGHIRDRWPTPPSEHRRGSGSSGRLYDCHSQWAPPVCGRSGQRQDGHRFRMVTAAAVWRKPPSDARGSLRRTKMELQPICQTMSQRRWISRERYHGSAFVTRLWRTCQRAFHGFDRANMMPAWGPDSPLENISVPREKGGLDFIRPDGC